MVDCTPRILTHCSPEELTQARPDTGCPNWETCLPWGGRLWSEAGCVKLTPGTPPPDGVYGRVVIANGCLVGVEQDDPPLYLGSPCAPLPGSCAEASGGGSTSDPSTTPGNLYTTDAVGRPLVLCRIEAGENISVSGDGTLENPYVITARIELQTLYAKSANDAIAVTGAGTRVDPVIIEHKLGHQEQIGQMVFDAYGHLVDVVASESGVTSITGVVPGAGLTGDTDRKTGVATIAVEQPVNQLTGMYQLGAWNVNVDTLNRIYNIERVLIVPAQTIPAGAYDVSINDLGSVTAVAPAQLGAAYLFNWSAGQAATRRYGAFTLRFDTALAGVLYTMGPVAFLKSIQIYIDDLRCDITPFGVTPAAPSTPETSYGIAFWANGVFGAGSHTLSIQATTPWLETSGAQVILNAVSMADNAYEDV